MSPHHRPRFTSDNTHFSLPILDQADGASRYQLR